MEVKDCIEITDKMRGFLMGQLGWDNLTEKQINEIKVLLYALNNIRKK